MTDVIACLPGDGIGPEVLEQALRVVQHLPLDVAVVRLPFGGAGIDEAGDPLPTETLEVCRTARAVLLGAVGGPRWDGSSVRPEAGLLGLRKELDVYANLRPATHGSVDLLKQVVVFKGNVVITQGTMTIRAARVEMLLLADCGHAPHRDQPAAVLAAVGGLLDRL